MEFVEVPKKEERRNAAKLSEKKSNIQEWRRERKKLKSTKNNWN